MEVFFLLVFGHMLADYPLQGQFISDAKNRHKPLPGIPWEQPMIAHCTIHAGMVYMVTGSLCMALAEFVVHMVIDDAKCAQRLSYRADQAFHIGCKVMWAFGAALFV